jgi:hypothetical protein
LQDLVNPEAVRFAGLIDALGSYDALGLPLLPLPSRLPFMSLTQVAPLLLVMGKRGSDVFLGLAG